MLRSDSRERKGWIIIAPYTYAVPLKNGQWTVYKGGWSSNGEDSTAGLEVVRGDSSNKPVRFNSLEEARQDNEL